MKTNETVSYASYNFWRQQGTGSYLPITETLSADWLSGSDTVDSFSWEPSSSASPSDGAALGKNKIRPQGYKTFLCSTELSWKILRTCKCLNSQNLFNFEILITKAGQLSCS